MRLLDRLLPRRPAREDGGDPALGFAVIDLETTGFAPERERVVEIAVVHVDTAGSVEREWTTLVHPERPSVGPTHVHGLTAHDLRGAPTFARIAGDLRGLLAGRVLVAHNAAFDLGFLAAEFARAGVAMPDAPHLCTLRASHEHLPALSRRRLADCCAALGVPLGDAHAALSDARAAAGLLGCYLRSAAADGLHGLVDLAHRAHAVDWPPALTAGTATLLPRGERRATPAAAGRFASLMARLPLDTPDVPLPEAAGYLELLTAALADGVLTEVEVDALYAHAAAARLTHPQVRAAHRAVLIGLARAAWVDGVVTTSERDELLAQAAALGLDLAEVADALDRARAERAATTAEALDPLPAEWALGEPLELGDRVAFTGGDTAQRRLLEARAKAAGLVVTSAVSRRTALLVTDDATSGTAKARAAQQHGTRIVASALFAVLVDHVRSTSTASHGVLGPPVPAPRVADVRTPEVLAPIVPAAQVRAWARDRGIAVPDRGRLPRHVVDAWFADADGGVPSS